MEAKGSSKNRTFIIPFQNTDGKRDVSKEDAQKPGGLKKTTSVRSFSFTAGESSNKEPLGRDQARSGIPNKSSTKEIKSEPLETKAVVKTFVFPVKYNAHSGIPFMASPKKCTATKPFQFGGKQKASSLTAVSNTTLQNPARTAFPNKKIQNKSKAMEKSKPGKEASRSMANATQPKPGKEASQNMANATKPKSKKDAYLNLATVTKPVFSATQIAMKNYSSHSGIPFKAKQLHKTTNPFATVTNESSSSDQLGSAENSNNTVTKG